MKIDLLNFIPKTIYKKEVIAGIVGDKLLIGNKIKKFNNKIINIQIRKINNDWNPQFKILRSLSIKNMDFDELMKYTKISYENLRWYIIRNKNSLLRQGFVKIKEKKFCPHKNFKGGVLKTIFSITNMGISILTSLDPKVNLPYRKELILTDSNNKEFILSSWWSSWLKPKIEDLEFDKNKQRFVWKIPKNHLLVQYEKSNSSLYSTIFPKEIKVDEELFITSLGLLLGEMRKRKGDISFSNTEFSLANYVLKFFEYFGLTKNNFKFSIQVNTRDQKTNKNNLKGYWSKELGINKDQISNIFEYPNYGTKRSKFGRIDFIYWNILFKEVIDNLINYFVKQAQTNRKYAIYLLRGLLASEGFVSPSNAGSLGRVGISAQAEECKKLIAGMFRCLEIKFSIHNHEVRISSKNNFDKIKKYDLLKISKDKKKFKRLYGRFKYKIAD